MQDLNRLINYFKSIDSEALPQPVFLSEAEQGSVPEVPTEAAALDSAEARVDPGNLPAQRLTLLSAQESRDKEIHNLIKKNYKNEVEKISKRTREDSSPPSKKRKISKSSDSEKNHLPSPKPKRSHKRSVYDIFTL